MGGVVVAVGTQRLPQQAGRPPAVGAVGVHDPAGERAAVRAPTVQVAGVATSAGVDAAEGGGGKGGEQQRMVDHRLGNGLAASHAGADEVGHVAGIQPRAGRALRGSPVPAPHTHHTQRVVGAGETRQHLTGGGVDPFGGAAESDRPDGVADPGQGVGPGTEVLRHQPCQDQLRHLRAQVVELEDATTWSPRRSRHCQARSWSAAGPAFKC